MRMLITAAALLIGTAPCAGQNFDHGPVHADVSVAIGIPQGDFEAPRDGEAIGATVFFGGPVPNAPVVLGTELGFMHYGTDSQLSLHSTVFDDGIDDRFAVPVEALNTSLSSKAYLGHFVVRLQPSSGVIQPYLDGLAGLKHFNSRLRIESDVIVFRRGLSQNSRITDWALSYGVGGGIELLLHEQETAWSDQSAHVSLHGGARYLLGRTARYASGEMIRDTNGRLTVSEIESSTDLIVVQFGIRVRH